MRSTKRQRTFSPHHHRTPSGFRARSEEVRAASGASAEPPERPTLSPRKRQVAKLLVDSGLSYKEIAARLDLSEGTIRTHTEGIYRKYKVHSRFELIAAFRAVEEAGPTRA
jgi:DNA-binding NarL/FixJ family response regulator